MAAIAMIALLLVVDLIIVGMVLSSARDHDLTVRRLETIQAFYAAEGGIGMARRELLMHLDEDGDGTIGTVSDDGDDGTDPAIGSANVVVTATETPPTTRLDSAGRSGASRRTIEAVLD